MLVRRHFNVQPNSFCVLCSTGSEEDLEHLFFTCAFARSCWNKIGLHWGAASTPDIRVLDMIAGSGIPFSMEIFVLATWEIWNLRNSRTFDNGSFSLRLWVRKFKDQVNLHLVRFREDKRLSIIQWLESIS